MAEEADLRFLSEQIKQIQDDVRVLRSDMAEAHASRAKTRSDLASLRADLVRMETKLDAFQEAVNDRFDQLDDLAASSFHDDKGREIDLGADGLRRDAEKQAELHKLTAS
jgi:hypothetical protein